MQANHFSRTRHHRPFTIGEAPPTFGKPNSEHVAVVLGAAREIKFVSHFGAEHDETQWSLIATINGECGPDAPGQLELSLPTTTRRKGEDCSCLHLKVVCGMPHAPDEFAEMCCGRW